MNTETDTTPVAWTNLIQALTLLSRGQSNPASPLHCEHDELTVMADPDEFTLQEIEQLEAWGFHTGDDQTFRSFRYGSA